MSSRVVTTEAAGTTMTDMETSPALVLRSHTDDLMDGQLQSGTGNEDRRAVIHWAPGTIDNEYMGKKKSKCCCIYEKPHNWDDPSSSSSSNSDDNDSPNPRKCTEHCRGHTKHCFTKKAGAKQNETQVSPPQVEDTQEQQSIPPLPSNP
ncbi:hypothetical protein TcWFU_000503 [Taenia crassiceps]|uniref:E3 ubiquitin-protein ligase PPP1R11 n=1 Tax=Taenia crassiceps TaxID=6207 RepID=A0ABR4Q4R4_9CEST